MPNAPNAVEFTADQAWFIADKVGAGSFPWVLAITPPYSDEALRESFEAEQRASLVAMGVCSSDGTVLSAVAQWIRVVCYCERWLELRYVGPSSELMRGIVARRGDTTVVALRNAQLVTFTEMTIDHPQALVPLLAAGLDGQPPARFPEFSLPARVGARADEQLRSGADRTEVLDFLGVPPPARPVIETALSGPRTYVEIAAGQRRNGACATSEVGVSMIDTSAGRVLVSPVQAPDGEWISTFAPGTPWAIAVAVEQLTATLPDGQWFPRSRLTRDFADSATNHAPALNETS